MRLLLTGADGFTGLHLIQAATKAGHTPIALSVDLQDATAVHAAVREIAPTHVIHLAGISHVMHANQDAFYDVNLFGSLNLLDALATLPTLPTKVILASSATVYGNCVHSPIRESEAPAPINHYAMSKLAMEFLARNYTAQLPIVVTRPFNYTGIGHHASFVIPKIIGHFQKRANCIELGNIDVYREYNDVRNVCECYLRLLTLGQPGQTYNIASGRAVALGAVIAILEALTNHQMRVDINPQWVRPNEIKHLIGDGTLLEQSLGGIAWRPLEDTLAWMLSAPQ